MAESDSRVSVESDGLSGVNQSYTEIIIVRHGETDWNALAKIQGHLDVDLNETGRQQAAAVADRLSREANISAIYSSDLSRAYETATIIASRFAGLQVIKDQGLRERHLGDLQGHVFQPQELMRLCPEAYKAFTSPSLDQEIPAYIVLETKVSAEVISYTFILANMQLREIRREAKYLLQMVGGESLNQLYERCTSAVQRIGDKHKGERVVIVTHGGSIRSLYKRASPKGRPGKVLNTAVSILHVADGGSWSMKTWNDTSHLNQGGFLKSGFGGDESSG